MSAALPPDPPALGVPQSLMLFAATVGLLSTLGGWLQGWLGLPGLAVSELAVVAAPTLLVAVRAALPPSGLGLRRPSLRSLCGAAIAGVGGCYVVSATIEAAIERAAPMPPAVRDAMRRLILPDAGARPFLADAAALALLPACCEELLFRGALLEAWRPAGRMAAGAASALAFGVFHLSMYKLAPTAALGALAAAVALRSGSVLPAMLFHGVNNLLVLILVRAGHDDPPSVTTLRGAGLCAGAGALLVLGLWLSGPGDAGERL